MSKRTHSQPDAQIEERNVHPIPEGSRPTGSPPVFEPVATTTSAAPSAAVGADAQLIKLSAKAEALWRQQDDLASLPGDIEGRRLRKIEKLWRHHKRLLREMANVEATTAAGLAAKAAPLVGLDDMAAADFLFLVDSVMHDAVRLGQSKPVVATESRTTALSPDHLERSPEQRLVDLNHKYERVIAFHRFACDAEDEAGATDEKKAAAEAALRHTERMLEEIQVEAYTISSHTIRTVALKARIMSYHKSDLWDPQEACEDADYRFLIEDVLALGGLDRIRPRDFNFADILPNYAGAELADPLPDAAVFTKAPPAPPNSIHALGAEAQALWDGYSRLDRDSQKPENKLYPAILENQKNALNERIAAIETQVSFMPAQSLADAMFLIAIIHDQLSIIAASTVPEFDSATHERRINRMLVSMMNLLSRMTGLSLEQTGVEAYMKGTIAMFDQNLADLDRVNEIKSKARDQEAKQRAAA